MVKSLIPNLLRVRFFVLCLCFFRSLEAGTWVPPATGVSSDVLGACCAGAWWGSVLLCVVASGSGVAGSLPLRVPLTSSESEEGGFKVIILCDVRCV